MTSPPSESCIAARPPSESCIAVTPTPGPARNSESLAPPTRMISESGLSLAAVRVVPHCCLRVARV